MRRNRNPMDIRLNAIEMAVKKLAEGCENCAQGYFDLARTYGASVEEIEHARSAVLTLTATSVSRRELLKRAAVATAGMTVLTTAGGFFPQFSRLTAMAADGAQIAWSIGPTTANGRHLIGIDPTSHIVGQVDTTADNVLRSPDGAYLYAISARKSGISIMTVVDVFNTLTGTLQQTIRGQTLALGSDDGWDSLVPTMSADGRYLAVLHNTHYVIRPHAYSVFKRLPTGQTVLVSIDDATIVTGVEIFDLSRAYSLDYLKLSASPANVVGGHVEFSTDNSHLYAFTAERGLIGTIVAVQFDGHRLNEIMSATDDQSGHRISAPVPFAPSMGRIQPDGRTSIRMVDDTVEWIDLSSLTITRQLSVAPSLPMSKPFPPLPLFSPDGAELYIARPALGTIDAVDLVQGKQTGTLTLPQSGIGIAPVDMRAIASAIVSPDGAYLYMTDGRGGDGIWVVHLPTLTVEQHWLMGQYIGAVWLSGDGQVLFGQDVSNGLLYVVDGNGRNTGTLESGGILAGFVKTDATRI